MKRTVVVSTILLLASALAFAESSTVTLQNQEGATFWFTVDPKELSDVAIGSRQLAEKVAAFFAEQTDLFPFKPLAPDSQLTLEGLAEGPHLLVGFFDVEGEGSLPVRAFSVQADKVPGDRFYALFSGPALLTVPREGGRLANLAKAKVPADATQAAEAVAAAAAPAEAVPAQQAEEQPPQAEVASVEVASVEVAPAEAAPAELVAGEQPPAEQLPEEQTPIEQAPKDQAPLEQAEASPPQELVAATEEAAPIELPPIASFSPTYSPVVFTRESRGSFTVLPIAQSRYWEQEGTRLDSLSGTIGDGTLRVSLRSANGFSRDVSYFFYLFAARTLGKENTTTIELLPLAKEGQGACVLWQRSAGDGGAAAAARIVGSVSVMENVCDLEIDVSGLPPEIVADLGDNPSIDLSSCRYDARSGVFEEFYYTTIQLADFASSVGETSIR
jgi:hypothetical protein